MFLHSSPWLIKTRVVEKNRKTEISLCWRKLLTILRTKHKGTLHGKQNGKERKTIKLDGGHHSV